MSTPAASNRVVARNTLVMMLGQALGMPLSMLVNAVIGRHLGAEEYGYFYLATTFAALGFLFVDWGLGAVLPARIANDRPRAGLYLGSTLLWQLITSPIVTLVLSVAFAFGDRRPGFQLTLALVCLGQLLAMVVRTCADAVRGFERTDVSALSQVGGQLCTAALVVPTLLLGGKLPATLLAMALAWVLVLVPVWRALRPAGIGALSADTATMKAMVTGGASFLVLNLVLTLQPAIDAYFLARLASHEAIGWHGAARKLIGPLIYPVGALISALYPTLCRLWVEDRDQYARTARSALRASLVMTVPLTVGCAAFAGLGVWLFSKQSFGPAEDNVRIFAVYLLLLYVTMILGTCLNAAGRQRSWMIVQTMCLVVSLVGDPLLVPFFQSRASNGGLGVAVTTTSSEFLMMVAGVWMLPKGIIDRSVLRTALLAAVAGGAMYLAARLLSGIPQLVAAPIAVAVYVGVAYLIGAIDKDQVAMLGSFVRRKSRR
jgi:O-antigen/teichoic acid export membrane protein